ncbi:MAG TPA: tetratricopeptide repeat protein, partial [Telluria sp.]|nr:tetratricopeptide repeat protein [Telluria sp.]
MQAHSTQAGASEQLSRIEAYLAVDPDNTDLLAQAIDLGLASGELARAQGHAAAALARYPDDIFFQYRHGHVLSAQQQWAAAAAVFAALLLRNADVNIAASLATCQAWLGQYQAIVDTLTPYRDAPELPAAAATALLRALHHLGRIDEASALVDAEVARLAGDAHFLGAASLLRLDQDRSADAAAFSEAALALGARSTEALVVSATLALFDSDTSIAVARFNQVLSANPNEGRSWSGLGMASLLKRDLGAAAEQLEQAVRLMPTHIGSWHTLGWCRIFGGELDKARAAFAQALALDRNFGETHGGLAVV